MKKYTFIYFILVVLSSTNLAHAQSTARTPELSNDRVRIWKTVIYPASNQALTMHRHDNDRVLVALSNGTLKITNDQQETHLFTLEKNKAYYLPKDKPNELHQDENISKHPITVMVIELKK